MKLNLENNKGYVILDDNTGKILDVYTNTKLGFDNKIIESYKREGENHFKIK